MLLMLTVFYTKKRAHSFETKLFSYMSITNLIGIIIDIVIVYLSYTVPFHISLYILNKVYLVYLLLWTSFLSVYFSYFSKNEKIKNIFNIIIFTTFLISTILIIFFPIELVNTIKIMYTKGSSVNTLYYALFVNVAIIIISVILNIKNALSKKYIPVLALLLFSAFAFIMRFIAPEILLTTTIITLINILMYFTIENPDLKLIEELNIAKAEAEKANLAKTDFLSSMSHEIRTPLNAITGFSHALLDIDNLPDDAIHYANDIIKSSDTLLEIVGGVLDVSKIESDKMELAEVIYSPVEEFEDLFKMAKSRLGDKPINISYNFAEDIPYQLYGDKVNMKKIVTNLLTNAVKYTYEGQIIFNVKCINKDNICNLIISVQDTGRGIKEESINKLFTKFERLGVDRNTTTEGTGLGLAITKKLVDLMGGSINVKSQYGEGSIFMAQIPQKICKQSKPLTDTQLMSTVEIQQRAKEQDSKLIGKKVLIVDDNALNIKVATISLKKLNLDIESVNSGEECIKLIKEGKVYDLILMDIMMPNMGGEECLGILKTIPGFNIPVIALTADAISGAREKYIEEGFNSYIPKPFSPDEIKKEIIKVIK